MARKTGRSSAVDRKRGWSVPTSAAIRRPRNVNTWANPFSVSCAARTHLSKLFNRIGSGTPKTSRAFSLTETYMDVA